MHLSNELQKRLDNLRSNVKLASTIDRILPDKYSFNIQSARTFTAEFASSDKDFSIVLCERTDKQNFNYCFARGLFTDLDKLASVIDCWVDKQYDILELKMNFNELELYQNFEFKNSNQDIENKWVKIKNLFFNDTQFWMQEEWKARYIEMLNEAKQYKDFQNYFPYTSHYFLKFSKNRDLTEVWSNYIYIIPTMYSAEIPNTLGKFYVSVNEVPMSGHFFETCKEGLDFYSRKLNEVQTINYNSTK